MKLISGKIDMLKVRWGKTGMIDKASIFLGYNLSDKIREQNFEV